LLLRCLGCCCLLTALDCAGEQLNTLRCSLVHFQHITDDFATFHLPRVQAAVSRKRRPEEDMLGITLATAIHQLECLKLHSAAMVVDLVSTTCAILSSYVCRRWSHRWIISSDVLCCDPGRCTGCCGLTDGYPPLCQYPKCEPM
jgi:hypothetical protein